MGQPIERCARLVSLAIVVVSFGVWAGVLGRFDSDLPRHDQWDTPTLQMLAWQEGRLDLGVLARPHNESRKLVPNLISLGLFATSGHYDIQAELRLGWWLGLLLVLGVGWVAWASTGRPTDAMLVMATYAATFWSAHTQFFHEFSVTFERLLPDLFLVGAIGLFASRGVTRGTTLAACVAGLLAQFSFAGGIAFWPAVLGFVLIAQGRAWRAVLPHVVAISVAAAISSALYFGVGAFPVPTSALDPGGLALVQLVPFVCTFVGNAFTAWSPIRTGALGAGAIVSFAVLVGVGLRGSRRPVAAAGDRGCVAAWASLGAFAIAQGVMACLGRGSAGIAAAHRSDYVTHPILLWVAVVALALALSSERRRPVVVIATLAVALAMTGTLSRSRFWRQVHVEQQRQAWWSACHLLIRHVEDRACLEGVFPPFDRRRTSIESRQSLLAHPALAAGPVEVASNGRGRVESVEWSDGRLAASGRAEVGPGRADAVAVALADAAGLHFVAVAPIGLGDLAARRHDRQVWQVDVALAESPDAGARARFFVVDTHAGALHPLAMGD